MSTDRPTLDTVALAAGVSRMTVSNAYNRPDQLSAATRLRVLEIAEQLGYAGPDPAGRSLRRGRVGATGVLLTEQLAYAFTDPGLTSFMSGLSSELGAAGQAMLLIPAEADQDGSLVRGAIVDAFIVMSMDARDPAVAAVVARRLPLVTAGHPRLPGVPFVGIDNRKSGAMAAEHLLGLGHHRVGVVALPGRTPSGPGDRAVPVRLGIQERLAGFTRAVLGAKPADAGDAGAGPGGAIVGEAARFVTVADAAANTSEAGEAAARELLDVPESIRPTAIFGVTDVLALGVLSAAGALGLQVPGQLSVIGFDDIAEARRSDPALTTVSQSLYDQGQEAARMALGLVAGADVRSPRIRAELVIRDSTGRRRNQPSP